MKKLEIMVKLLAAKVSKPDFVNSDKKQAVESCYDLADMALKVYKEKESENKSKNK